MILGQKPWIIPLGKCPCFALLNTLFFWSKNRSFLSRISKTIFSDLISPKNTNKKNFDFWTKTMDYPLWKVAIFFDLFQFSGLKFILFYPEYKETIFSKIITSKTPMRKNLNFGQNHALTFQKEIDFLALLTKLPFWSKNHSFLSKISKNHLSRHDYTKNPNKKKFFSDLITPKKPNEKKFDF